MWPSGYQSVNLYMFMEIMSIWWHELFMAVLYAGWHFVNTGSLTGKQPIRCVFIQVQFFTSDSFVFNKFFLQETESLITSKMQEKCFDDLTSQSDIWLNVPAFKKLWRPEIEFKAFTRAMHPGGNVINELPLVVQASYEHMSKSNSWLCIRQARVLGVSF